MIYSVAPSEEEQEKGLERPPKSGTETSAPVKYRIIATEHNIDGELLPPHPVEETVYDNEQEALFAAYLRMGDEDSFRRDLERTWRQR